MHKVVKMEWNNTQYIPPEKGIWHRDITGDHSTLAVGEYLIDIARFITDGLGGPRLWEDPVRAKLVKGYTWTVKNGAIVVDSGTLANGRYFKTDDIGVAEQKAREEYNRLRGRNRYPKER